MTDYQITSKDVFTVLGIGTTLTGDYSEIPAQKQTFWDTISKDGRWTNLLKQAKNNLQFAVNEAIDGAMHYYAGVETNDAPTKDDERAVQFPSSEYLVVSGEADTALNLFNQLEGAAFGEVLPSLNDKAYVGGPNAAVITGNTDDGVKGEMWIPLSDK